MYVACVRRRARVLFRQDLSAGHEDVPVRPLPAHEPSERKHAGVADGLPVDLRARARVCVRVCLLRSH